MQVDLQASAASASALSSPSRPAPVHSLPLDDEGIAESWDVAYCYAFLAKLGPLLDQPLWPATIDAFEDAMMQPMPSSDHDHPDQLAKPDWKPTLEPVMSASPVSVQIKQMI